MTTIGDAEQALNRIAPPEQAESWDNVGLLAGDRSAICRSMLLCIDLSPSVLDEAEAAKSNLLVCYHPPLFKPLNRLRADCAGSEALLWRAARAGCAIYSPHTALDAAEGGTNDTLARLCDLTDVRPLGYSQAGPVQTKIIVFVPPDSADPVAEALFAAGAGWIGRYHHCSFRMRGEGTFWGTDQTHPAVGRSGRLERVDEVRLEAVCPRAIVAEAVAAIRRTHPYEEPAVDILPLEVVPGRTGPGRLGRLASALTVGAFAEKLARSVNSGIAMLAGDPGTLVERVAVFAGSAGRSALQLRGFAEAQALVTGELKHHDAIAYVAAGKAVIALGHWASERPMLADLATRIAQELPSVPVRVSETDRDIWRGV